MTFLELVILCELLFLFTLLILQEEEFLRLRPPRRPNRVVFGGSSSSGVEVKLVGGGALSRKKSERACMFRVSESEAIGSRETFLFTARGNRFADMLISGRYVLSTLLTVTDWFSESRSD